MFFVSTSSIGEEAQLLPVASASTSLVEFHEGKDDAPGRQNCPAGEASVAAAVDDASHIALLQEGIDSLMDCGQEAPDKGDEGVVLNQQGAGAAAEAGRDAEHILSQTVR